MDAILICIIILGIICIVIGKRKPDSKADSNVKTNTKADAKVNVKTDPEPDEPEPTLMQYPYRKKYLLTKAEYIFYKLLKSKCDERNMLICPKVRLEDFIQITAKEQVYKYRGYIKSRHVDFLLCDSGLNIIAAVELDDNSHRTQKAQKADEFKNNLFNAIQIPLHRVIMANGSYETAIDNLLNAIPANSTIRN